MGLVVLVLHGRAEEISLGPSSVAALADLGVTSVALAGGEGTVAVVLEGWAFDPERAGDAAHAVGAGSAAALRPLGQMAVSTIACGGDSS